MICSSSLGDFVANQSATDNWSHSKAYGAERVKVLEPSARFKADLGAVGLGVISGYLKIDSGYLTNFFDRRQIGVLELGCGAGPMQTALCEMQGADMRTQQFSQEVRLTSQSSGPLSYILGAH